MCAKGGKPMKSKVFLFVLVLTLLSFVGVYAEERKIGGEVSVTAEHLRITGEKAKYNEYRDIRDGFYGAADLQYESGNYYIDFKANDVGRKTQSYDLSGGKWGSFKYYLSYDQLPHNFTYGAKTFYTGTGGANLSYPTSTPSTNVATWNTFDYSLERRTYAGGFKFDYLKPFYFDASVSQENRKGLYPFGTAGTSPGGITIELPSPIDFQTNNLKLEAGYVKTPLSLSISYLYSTFQNDNSNLNFRNPATANTAAAIDTYTLAPKNDYYKLGFQGAVKIPWNSKFNVDLATARAQSDANLFNSYISDTTAATSNIGTRGRTGITLSDYVFNGKVDTQSYNFVFTTSPIYFLDGKAFYKYYKRSNKSDQITTTDSTANPNTFTNSLFGYHREKAGAELGFKLPASFYLSGGYTWDQIKRDREDIPKNEDDTYNVDLRWSGLDFLVAKAGYARLHRTADFEAPSTPGLDTYARRYDAAPKDRDTYKASLDLFPLENLSFTLGYKYKKTHYPDTSLGLQDAWGNEFSADADYLIMKWVRLFGYFDFEYVKLNQYQRQATSAADSNPALTPTSTAFNWTVTQTERNYGYGLGAEVYVIPKKLTVRLQQNTMKSDGYTDYTYLLGTNPLSGGRTQGNIDTNAWDTYRLTSYMVKGIYNINQSFSVTGGWAYEKYVYDDAQYNGYQYVPATTGSSGAYLTGAYSNPSYTANVFFLSAAFRF